MVAKRIVSEDDNSRSFYYLFDLLRTFDRYTFRRKNEGWLLCGYPDFKHSKPLEVIGLSLLPDWVHLSVLFCPESQHQSCDGKMGENHTTPYYAIDNNTAENTE